MKNEEKLNEIAQLADQITREHPMTIKELKQRGLIKDDTIIEKYIIPKKDIDLYLKCKILHKSLQMLYFFTLFICVHLLLII